MLLHLLRISCDKDILNIFAPVAIPHENIYERTILLYNYKIIMSILNI